MKQSQWKKDRKEEALDREGFNLLQDVFIFQYIFLIIYFVEYNQIDRFLN